MDFGEILKKLRKEYKYTQEQLADRLGVANSTVSMYERGERFPDYEMMKSIAKLFSVDMNYLYDNKTQANAENIGSMKFAEILKSLRKQNNVTQDTLAKQLNVSKSTISMYENGERMPPPDMIEAIADRFNVSINYLFGRDDSTTHPSKLLPPSFPLTPHETSVMIAYRNHPNEQAIVDKILDVPAEEETVTLYSAAHSKDNTPDEIITISKAEWERLKSLPFTDQDLT